MLHTEHACMRTHALTHTHTEQGQAKSVPLPEETRLPWVCGVFQKSF